MDDDYLIDMAFTDPQITVGNGTRQVALLVKMVRELQAEVERLKGVELALAQAESHITAAHNVLGLCRDYSKELTRKVDRLIGPESD